MLNKNNKLIIAFFAVIIIGLLLAAVYVKDTAEKELSPEIIAEKAISHINKNFLSPGMTASLVDISDAGSVYRISLEIEGTEFDSFASKDGMFLFPEGYDLREDLILEEPQQSEASELSDIDPQELAGFIDCLAKADFIVYGADWCGWTTQLMQMLGGLEIMESIYVECTEKSELCQEKNIAGYPTILINDKQYQRERTLKGFSEATGCPAPAGSENQGTENPAGGC